MDSELVRSLGSVTGADDPALVAEIRDEAATLLRGAEAVTRRLLDDWIPDLHADAATAPGWFHVGSGMRGDGEPITDDEAAWLAYMEDRPDA